MPKRIIVTGATGFIGKALCRQLVQQGYDVVALSRNPNKGMELLGNQINVVKWDAHSADGWIRYADGAYAIIRQEKTSPREDGQRIGSKGFSTADSMLEKLFSRRWNE